MDTPWDKFRLWLFKGIFRNDYEDLKADSYTQGVSDGYRMGFKQADEYIRANAKKLFGIDL